MGTKVKRRQFSVVNRSLQYGFLAMVLSYSIIIAAFLAAFLFVPDINDMNNEDLSVEIRAAAAKRIFTLHSRVWPSVIALVCVLNIHSFRAFHRIAGPLYRFRWAFAKIGKGNLNFRVKLRSKDYLNQEAEMFNEMIEVLAEKWGSMQFVGLKALKSMDGLEQSLNMMSGTREANKHLLQIHRQHLETLVDQTRYFRLIAEDKVEQIDTCKDTI
ncbi:MAG: hypothetical protein ISS41_02185 [Candidatus Aminicenantes bacterium]|nr:hypothetical protein [Candidatus Aminicenantes bacterium]MBL7082423.1 hypothetical protein [Candidatus Aminicenantes bacterium]NQT80248.1 hypothetical protein [Candidatus Aminicenantes bacterium]